MIEVKQTRHADPFAFAVTIREATGEIHYIVTMSKLDCDWLTMGSFPPERCIEAAFRFLLAREPKETILPQFDISVIPRYFPEFEDELPRYLASGSAAGDSP